MCHDCVNKLAETIIKLTPSVKEDLSIDKIIGFTEVVFMLADKMKETSEMSDKHGINYLALVDMSQLNKAIEAMSFLNELFSLKVGDTAIIELDFNKIMDDDLSKYK